MATENSPDSLSDHIRVLDELSDRMSQPVDRAVTPEVKLMSDRIKRSIWTWKQPGAPKYVDIPRELSNLLHQKKQRALYQPELPPCLQATVETDRSCSSSSSSSSGLALILMFTRNIMMLLLIMIMFVLFPGVSNYPLHKLRRECEECGAHRVPYPLSTGESCGDPGYSGFLCDRSTGLLTFQMKQVIEISTESDYFSIQVDQARDCDSVVHLDNQSQFAVQKCEHLISTPKESLMIQIGWKQVQEPLCNTSMDCLDWKFTTCRPTYDGRSKRCVCLRTYAWSSTSINCTRGSEGDVPHKPDKVKASSKSKTILIYAISAVVIIVISAVVGGFVYLKKHAAAAYYNEPRLVGSERRSEIALTVPEVGEAGSGIMDQEGNYIQAFTFKTLSRATKRFSENKKLGQGGFGQVYKGVLPGGEEVAVKRLLINDSSQGLDELENEIRILRMLQHQNIVRLLGSCIENKEKLLVYEYMSRKSLDVILFDETTSTELTWDKRRELILGIARGMLYIHQDAPLRVVHLDLKPENILLDSQMTPKISDFGFSQILEENQTQGRIKKVAGTTGYQAPEYAVLHRFSPASDVYSYGVVMLEILCGRKCTSYHDPEGEIFYVTDYAWSVWEKGNVTDLLDKTVAETCSANEAKKYIKLALLCAQNLPDVRPSMSWIVSFLCDENNTHESLPAPQKTVYYGSNDWQVQPSTIQEMDAEVYNIWKSLDGEEGASTSGVGGKHPRRYIELKE